MKIFGICASPRNNTTEYVLKTADDMKLINNNLSSCFVLGANIDLTNSDIKPIGMQGENVKEFNGKFSGSLNQVVGDNVVTNKYSITFQVKVIKEILIILYQSTHSYVVNFSSISVLFAVGLVIS